MHLDDLRSIVSKNTVFELDHHTFHEEPNGALTFLDLPTFEMAPSNKSVVKCFLDVVLDVPGPIPKTDIKEHLMSHSPLTDLPSPFGLKKDLGQSQRCRIDLAAVKQADDKFCVVKIMNFKDEIKTAEALSVCMERHICLIGLEKFAALRR